MRQRGPLEGHHAGSVAHGRRESPVHSLFARQRGIWDQETAPNVQVSA